MIDNTQTNINEQKNGPGTFKMPTIQASPSGGVVATLQPGQSGFEDNIKIESARKDNFVEQNGVTDFRQEVATKVDLPQTVENRRFETKNMGQAEQNQQKPASVLNYKVGNDLQKKKKKSLFLPILFGILGLAIIGGLIFYFYEKRVEQLSTAVATPKPEPEVITLDYWGLWEPSTTLTQVLRDFETKNPGISVNYIKQDVNGYRARLENAIETSNGPDVFRYHASWRSYLDGELDAVPQSVMTTDEFKQTFYPVVAEQLTNEKEEIKGIPLMYDSLALLYNKDLYAKAGLEVPQSWAQFRTNALKLTKYGADNYIETSGAAMGLSSNIDFTSDIIGMLILQSGGDFNNLNQKIVSDVLAFYTNFYNIKQQRVWDSSFDNSLLAFARGETAMIFAPSWAIHDVLLVNPNLNIGVASVPQLNKDEPVEWATYWVEGVNTNSPRKEAAWKLLSYLSSEEVLRELYAEQADLRLFGEIYPRRAMADLLADDPYLQPYLWQADKARSFPINDRTFDEALDDENKNWIKAIIDELTIETEGTDKDYEGAGEDFINGLIDNLTEWGYFATEEEEVTE